MVSGPDVVERMYLRSRRRRGLEVTMQYGICLSLEGGFVECPDKFKDLDDALGRAKTYLELSDCLVVTILKEKKDGTGPAT